MEGISGGHLIHPVTQAGSPRALFPGQHPGTLEYLQEQRFSTSWAVTESRQSPSQLKVLPHTLREHPVLPFVPITSGPTTGHHWKEPGSLLLAPSFKVIIHIQKMLPRWSGPLITSLGLFWIFSSMSLSLLCWGAQNWIQYSTGGLTSAE